MSIYITKTFVGYVHPEVESDFKMIVSSYGLFVCVELNLISRIKNQIPSQILIEVLLWWELDGSSEIPHTRIFLCPDSREKSGDEYWAMRARMNLTFYCLVSFHVLPSEFNTGLYLTFGKWWNINSKPKGLVHEVDFNLAQMKGSKQAINVIVLISIEVLFIEKKDAWFSKPCWYYQF